MSESHTCETVQKMAVEFLQSVIEHADSVQVLITFSENGVTRSYENGRGNWFARYGQMRQWVIKEEEKFRIEENMEAEEES